MRQAYSAEQRHSCSSCARAPCTKPPPGLVPLAKFSAAVLATSIWSLPSNSRSPDCRITPAENVVGAVVEHGESPVAEALDAALASGRSDLLALQNRLKSQPKTVAVPEGLEGFHVEAPPATDYDALLSEAGR